MSFFGAYGYMWRRCILNKVKFLLERRMESGCWKNHILCSLHKQGLLDDLTLKHKLFLAIDNFKYLINDYCIYE